MSFITDLLFGAFLNKQRVYVWNPDYHHGLTPNFYDASSWGDENFSMVTNNLGMRDCCVRQVTPRAARYRILFVGDSFTEGVGVTYADSIVGQIGRRLEIQFPNKLEVLNAGVVSYSPKLMDLKISYLSEQQGLKFDELHVFVDISDAYDELKYEAWQKRSRTSPRSIYFGVRYFLVRWSFVYSHFLTDSIDLLFSRIKADLSASAASATPTFGGSSPERRKQLDPSEINTLKLPGPKLWRLEETPRKDIAAFKSDWTYNQKSYRSWAAYGLQLASANLKNLVLRMQKDKIPLTIHVYPWPKQIENNDFPSRQEIHWRQFARKHGVGFQSHFGLFDPKGRLPHDLIEKYYIPGDMHWNSRGHAVIADNFLRSWCKGSLLFPAPNRKIPVAAASLIERLGIYCV